jgi:hypothetical protein
LLTWGEGRYLLGRDPQGGGLVPIDVHDDLGARDLEVRVDVLEARQPGHLLLDDGRPVVELLQVGILQGVLVEGLGELPADPDGG